MKEVLIKTNRNKVISIDGKNKSSLFTPTGQLNLKQTLFKRKVAKKRFKRITEITSIDKRKAFLTFHLCGFIRG